MPLSAFLIPEAIIGAIIEMGLDAGWSKLRRKDRVLGLLKKLRLPHGSPDPDFDSIYAFALVEFGAGAPRKVLEFFRHKFIKEKFASAFATRDGKMLTLKEEARNLLEWHDLGDEFRRMDYDPISELTRFELVFRTVANRARSVHEIKVDHKLDDIHAEVERVLKQLEPVKDLAALREEVQRLIAQLDDQSEMFRKEALASAERQAVHDGAMHERFDSVDARLAMLNPTRPGTPTAPPPAPHFTGRGDAIDAILSLLASNGKVGLVAVQALGGMGKTATALEIAHRHKDRFPDGILWAALGPEADGMVRLAGWVTSLGGQPAQMTDVQSRQGFIRDRANGRQMLAIIDDVWTTSIDAARALRDALPAGMPRLVTTRNSGVAKALGCALYRLDFMPGDQALDLVGELAGEIGAYGEAAEQIILCCAGLSHAEADLRAKGEGWLSEIDVLPLAIRLAAGLADAPADLVWIAEALQSAPLLPQLAGEDVTDRQSSVERTFSMSYERLPDDDARRCFRRLAAFAPPPAPFQLAHVAGVWEMELPAARIVMQCLVRRSLVERAGDSAYRMHGLVAQYAAALLADAGETDAARGRHAEIYQNAASGLKDVDWQAAEAAMPQFRHGFAHAIAQGNGELAEGYLAGLWRILHFSGLWDQHLQWREAALELARAAGDERSASTHLYYIAMIHRYRGDLDGALDLYDESLEIQESLGDRQGKSATLHAKAYILRVRGDLDGALDLYDESLEIKESLGDRRGIAMTLGMSAQLLAERGEREEALRRSIVTLQMLLEMKDSAAETAAGIIAGYRRNWGAAEFDPLWRAAAGSDDLPDWLTAE